MAEATGRRLFGPVVLGGLGSAAIVAVASARDWFRLGSNEKVGFLVPDDQLRADMPLALALSLVLLAAWGVVLVTGVRAPVWQAGPSWSTLTSTVSPSQSRRTSTTCCRWPDVSPLTQYS